MRYELNANICIYLLKAHPKTHLSAPLALNFSASAAHVFGVLGANCTLKRSRAIDNLIAAHAISQQVVLVTINEKDFKNYPGLKVENWV